MAVGAVAVMLLAATTATDPVQRCGWYLNPTPGNLLLRDADGDW